MHVLLREEEYHNLKQQTPGVRRVRVWLDAPWLPPEERQIQINPTEIQENTLRKSMGAEREGYLNEGWKEHGYQKVQTTEGTNWVHQRQAELARRARSMAGMPDEPDFEAESDATSGLGQESLDEQQAEAPGFLRLWGSHLAIVTTGIVLLALVSRTLLFR